VTLTPIDTTEAAVTEHLRCFGAADVDGIVAGYAEDAAMHTPAGTARGHAALRQVFVNMFSEFARPTTTFQMKQQIYDGEIGFIVWSAETDDNVYELGTDTFVVRDGKIVSQTFVAKMTPKH
jgi:ketosteroid isomerase-like protein